MTVFSFRAEALPDVAEFQKLCSMIGLQLTIDEKPHFSFPDTAVEIKIDATLEALRDLMRRVEDGHVMLQTLRECPLAENSLERDRSIE